MWTDLPCQNFHLLVCCAILDSEKQKIMEENYGFNEILKVSFCLRQLFQSQANPDLVVSVSVDTTVSAAAHQRAFNEAGH